MFLCPAHIVSAGSGGTVLAAFLRRLSPTTSRLRTSPMTTQRLSEGGHDGAGDAVVVVVVFGDGVGGLAVFGLGVDHGHAVARCL